MIYISEYGNINEKHVDKENNPDYIVHAINAGFFVKVNVWLIEDCIHIGKIHAQYVISDEFIHEYKNKLWFCAQTAETYNILIDKYAADTVFMHDFTLKNISYTSFETTSDNTEFILFSPEAHKTTYEIRDIWNHQNCKGICSSYVAYYKQLYESKIKYAMLISGRWNCHQYNLFPQILKYLNDNKDEWIDIHVAVNDDADKLNDYLNDKFMDAPFVSSFTCKKFEVPDYYINHSNNAANNSRNTISMFYTQMLAYQQLLQYAKYYKYNIVIKYRPDITSQNLPNLKDFIEYENIDIIYTPSIHRYGKKGYNYNDQIGIGNVNVMRVYCHVYPYLDVYVNEFVLHPESLLQYHLQKHDIKTELFDYNYNLDCRRLQL
jgi:hypothetical protein